MTNFPTHDGMTKFVKELLSKLRKEFTTPGAGQALMLPWLIHCREMAYCIMKELTHEEKRFGFEFLKKNYPKSNLNIFLESNLNFQLPHLAVIEEVVLPSQKVNLDNLLRMFNKINTSDPEKAGYLDPQRLKDDGTIRELGEIRASLQLLVERVKNKKQAFQATPKAGTPELVEYYTKLENSLAFITEKLGDPSCDRDVRTSALFDLAIAGGHCGTRYKTETAAWAKFLSRGINPLTLKEEIEKLLQNLRVGVVERMAKKMTYPDGRRIELGNRPHTYNQIVRTIGAKLALELLKPMMTLLFGCSPWIRFTLRFTSYQNMTSLMQ